MPHRGDVDPVFRLEEVLLAQGLPNVTILDVGWSLRARHFGLSESLRVSVENCGMFFRRPHRGSCESLSTLGGVVRGYVNSRQSDSMLIVLCARVTGDWKQRYQAVRQIVGETSGVRFLALSRAASNDPQLAIAELADLLGGFAQAEADDSGEATTDAALGELAKTRSGVENPLVLAVCGIPEKQGHAAALFPQKAREQFGIEGRWIFTDYDHPENVIQSVRQIHASSILPDGRSRLVAVVFAHFFNATNAKRDGMEFLRSVGVQCSAPPFKSLGSALQATKQALCAYVGFDVDANTADEEAEQMDEKPTEQ